MAYFWLNQFEDYQGYGDVEGEVYNYRNNVPGHRILSAGDRFVYYRPGVYVIFGGGTIGGIKAETADADREGGGLTDQVTQLQESWSESKVNTMRSGIVSRMHELGLIECERVGQRGIAHTLTDMGETFVSDRDTEVTNR